MKLDRATFSTETPFSRSDAAKVSRNRRECASFTFSAYSTSA